MLKPKSPTTNYQLPTTKFHGFTLIELLVAATIAIILTTIGVVSYQSAMRKSRDGKRKADLEQIRAALEMYRSDCGSYPASISFGGSLVGGKDECSGNTYMQEVPQDPRYSTYEYSYTKSSDSYVLCAYLEGESADLGCSSVSCGSCGDQSCNYKVCPP